MANSRIAVFWKEWWNSAMISFRLCISFMFWFDCVCVWLCVCWFTPSAASLSTSSFFCFPSSLVFHLQLTVSQKRSTSLPPPPVHLHGGSHLVSLRRVRIVLGKEAKPFGLTPPIGFFFSFLFFVCVWACECVPCWCFTTFPRWFFISSHLFTCKPIWADNQTRHLGAMDAMATAGWLQAALGWRHTDRSPNSNRKQSRMKNKEREREREKDEQTEHESARKCEKLRERERERERETNEMEAGGKCF